MKIVFFVILPLVLSIVVVFITFRNRFKTTQVMPETDAEVEPPPFDESILDRDLQKAIKMYKPYETTTDIERLMEDKALTDANSQLCYAYYIWLDLMMTSEYSNDALAIMDKSLEKQPNHAPTLQFSAYVKSKIDAAREKADLLYKELYSIPIEKLTLKQAEDFVNYISSYKTDKEDLELEYKLWMKLYNEAPDTIKETINGLTQTFSGQKYFYLQRATTLLWAFLEHYEEARPNLWKIINWPNTEDVILYRGLDVALYYLIEEAVRQSNRQEFIHLVNVLEEKYKSINVYHASATNNIPVMPQKFIENFAEYALSTADTKTMKYVIHILLHSEVNVLTKTTKKYIYKMEEVLANR